MVGLTAGVMLAGCNLWPFVYDSERTQITYIRSFKNLFSPSYNKSLGVALREIGSLLSYGLPTRYGIDVSSYLGVLPTFSLPRSSIQVLVNKDAGTQELKSLYAAGNMLDIESVVSAVGTTNDTFQYLLTANRTPLGTTGKLTVTTQGSNWLPLASAAGMPYVLNQGRYPQVPKSLTAIATLTLPQSMGTANVRADLSQFEQSGSSQTQLPRSLSVVLQTANIAGSFSGSFTSLQSAMLSGSLTLKDKSNETYATQITLNAGDAQISCLNDARAFRLDLAYTSGSLTGTAKATDGRLLDLASFQSSSDGSSVLVKYADGTQETWNFALPGN